MEAQMVEAGLVNLGVLLGLFSGVIIGCATVYLLYFGRITGFRRYYNELDESVKKEVQVNIEAIRVNLEQLANNTNTKYFKAWHNDFSKFLAHLKQRWMNS